MGQVKPDETRHQDGQVDGAAESLQYRQRARPVSPPSPQASSRALARPATACASHDGDNSTPTGTAPSSAVLDDPLSRVQYRRTNCFR